MNEKGLQHGFAQKLTKVEPFALVLTLLGFIASVQNWNQMPVSIILIVGAGSLTVLYFLKAQFYVDVSWKQADRNSHRVLFIGLALGMLAFMFHIQDWPKWEPLMFISMLAMCVGFMGIALRRGSLLKFMNAIELSSLLLVMIYFIRTFWGNL
jgi:hypothetical protein